MGKKHKNKMQQISKVAAETHADPKDLARLPQDALQAIDDAIPDTDDSDLLGGDTQEAPSSDDAGVLGQDDGGDGVQEDGNEDGNGGSVDSPGVPQDIPGEGRSSGQLGSRESEHSSGDTPAVSSSGGTQVVAETMPEAGADIPPTETPKSPDEVENPEGQGSSGEILPPESPADSVVKDNILLGEHPVTGAPVHLNEQ